MSCKSKNEHYFGNAVTEFLGRVQHGMVVWYLFWEL